MGSQVAAYDFCAIIILAVIAAFYFRMSVHGTSRAHIMTALVAATIASSVFDSVRIGLAGYEAVSETVLIAVDFAFYLFVATIPFFYFMYAIASSNMWHKLPKLKTDIALIASPVAVNVAVLVAGLFVPVSFERYLIFIIFAIYILMALLFLCINIYRVDRKKFCVLLMPAVIVSAGLAAAAVQNQFDIVCFCVAVCVLMLVLINRRVEESVDLSTGMHTYKVFAEDMNINFKTGKHMELILISIINFKYAIRLLGYDEMLRMMGEVSDEIFGIMMKYHAQFMCYYNGDGKFAIELSRKNFEHAREIADEISYSISRNIKMETVDFDLAINTCLVKCPDDVSDIGSLFMLISDLDISGASESVVSAATITGTQEFSMKMEMSMIIDRALANHYFSVFYQPIYDTGSGKFRSAEALLRLRDPKYGYISPQLFIPLAEKSGAIHAIGRFVLEEVIKFIASPDFAQLGVDYIEINLSVMQCLRSDLADEVIDLARKYDVNPSKVNLEITETASGYSQSKIYTNITRLAQNGFSLALDDFGTGYSNLMRIAQLPLGIVKLDRAFVILEEKGGNHVIIKNMIKMLKNMNLKVLVEGVETVEMADSFTSMGVDEIQGFYYSKPLSKSAYIRFLQENTA